MQPTGRVPHRLARPFAFAGLVLFGGSLIFFVYQYAVVFGRIETGGVSVRPIAENVALFSVFALHHTVFARDNFRKWVTNNVGDLERSLYVWIASLLFIAVCALWQPVAGVAWQPSNAALAALLTGAQLVGVWLSLRSAFLIDVRELSGLKQVSGDDSSFAANRAKRPAAATTHVAEFKTRGPYGWVRHPIYAGWFLIVFCAPAMTLTRLVFAVTSSAYLLVAIPFEERSLRHASGGAYDDYMRKVRWKLVPHLF